MPHFMKLFATVLCLGLLSSCSFDDSGTPPLEPFSKREQERIGNRIHFAVLAASGYEFVLQVPPFDTTIIELTNTWYAQLTAGIQKDLSSPTTEKWDKDRPWIVTLIDDPDIIAVAAPGGYLYLSTGMLNTLDRENQLFFVMALEAAAVRQEIAMRRLIEEFGTNPLRRLARGVQGPTVPSASDLSDWLFAQSYSASEIDLLDEDAAVLMCSSSIYSPTGLSEVLGRMPDSGWWWEHRTYPGRGADWSGRAFPNCGTRTTVGLYAEKVKPYLP